MHRHVLTLMVLCLLSRMHADDSGSVIHGEHDHQQLHLATANDRANGTVQETGESGKDIDAGVEAPLLASAATPVEEPPEPTAIVDNHLTEVDMNSEKSEDGDAQSAKISEPSVGPGSKLAGETTDAEKSGDQTQPPLPASGASQVLDSASGDASSVAITEPSVGSGSNLTGEAMDMEKKGGHQAASPLVGAASLLYEAKVTDEEKMDDEPLDIASGDASTAMIPEISVGSGILLTDDASDMEIQSARSNQSETDSEHRDENAQAVENELVDQEEQPSDEKDTPASMVESEGMFTVKTKPPVAMEQTMEEPMYSGDGPQEPKPNNLTAWFDYQDASSGDGQIESQGSSGEGEQITRRPVAATRNLGSEEKPLPENVIHPPAQHLSCEDVPCEGHHHLKVSASTAGGVVIPAGVELLVRCSAQSLGNDTAVINWHRPQRKASGDNETLDGEFERRLNITEEILDLRGHDKRITVSTLKLVNVSEKDAGTYTCAAVLTGGCCQSNHTLGIRIYVPPSYAVDFAIVGAVCFVEFLVILYFKTRSDRQGQPKATAGRADNGYKADYQPLPMAAKSKEVQIEEEEQQRLT